MFVSLCVGGSAIEQVSFVALIVLICGFYACLWRVGFGEFASVVGTCILHLLCIPFCYFGVY